MKTLYIFLIILAIWIFNSCAPSATLTIKEKDGEKITEIKGSRFSNIVDVSNSLVAVQTGKFAPNGKNGVRVRTYNNNSNRTYNYNTNHNSNNNEVVSTRKHIGTLDNYKIYWNGRNYSMDGIRAKHKSLRRMLSKHPKIHFIGDKEFQKILKKIIIAPGVDWEIK